MALLGEKGPPRVWIEENGKVFELLVENIDVMMDYTFGRYEPYSREVTIRGRMTDREMRASEANLLIAGKAGEPYNVGGIPEECILTCSACGFMDSESLHQCSA